MKLEQFLHVKLLKNDVSKENLVKFRNHVKSKPLEPVLWNFAWKTLGYMLSDDTKQNYAIWIFKAQ